MAGVCFSVSFVSLLTLLSISGIFSASFTINNNCGFTVWPGVLSGAGTVDLSSTGFALQKGESKILTVPVGWSGRLWGRTHCTEDSAGIFSCGTGDCGSRKLECVGGGAGPPATLAEFTLNGAGGLDFYDASLVDGYNLPMLISPQGGSGGNCSQTGCLVDLNGYCPSELKLSSADGSESVACKSACEAFGAPEYCCSGAYGNPDTCKPTSYSLFFKNACPRAYSYAYDDGTSTFTCATASYLITFCPTATTATRQKSSDKEHPEAAELPLINNTMTLLGEHYANGAASSTVALQGQVIASAITIFVSISRLLQLL